eukprot:4005486-Karenia_brevis.AAC.1
MGHQKFRVAVRGSFVSYQMPWEEILKRMNEHRADRNVLDIPRPQDYLKYMLRVHLQVNGVDFKRHLRQVMRKRRCTKAQGEHAHCS